ncbi:NERD domain-containing protein [Rossellomorea aquimaris]|uniref:nuclease-related domain-containing protein n=1 Tax=Rossellomorea aquimaris TaxID=189382 RepID=UPI001CD207FF|nr:nuclease-related domain-containing protein [Rossellomorea aquimaris]MCA1055455.1 NERD domain-containing protein [Rossellomorea aquimaris]
MIKKKPRPPIKIFKLYALLRRILRKHPLRHEIEAELRKLEAGYKGELSLTYHVRFLPDKEYVILFNLRLSYKDFFFQIDALVLHTNFILIAEVKNIAGEIFIDTNFNQMIRTRHETTEVFPDPILQAYKQKEGLENWLITKNHPDIPIEYRVVLTNNHTFIKNSPQDKLVLDKLIRSERLVYEVKKLTLKYPKPVMTTKELNRLAKQLMKSDIPHEPDLLSQFQLSSFDILPGVHCVECQSLSMQRIQGTWWCPTCRIKKKDAHIEALQDYALLVDTTISNQEMRCFTHLQSLSSAARMLSQMNLPSTGTTRNRRYSLQPLITDLQ